MRLARPAAVGAAALCSALVFPLVASAAVTTTTANLNLRAGPSTRHRIITTIPAGSRVNIHSCGHEWCQVTWTFHTGFANGRFLIKHVTVPVSPLNHIHR